MITLCRCQFWLKMLLRQFARRRRPPVSVPWADNDANFRDRNTAKDFTMLQIVLDAWCFQNHIFRRDARRSRDTNQRVQAGYPARKSN
ncbi:hypothetical protein ASC96_29420 [Rhizobium sp. Root1204]|nr:hypothetical protein ASC96_29420 [Rhizobium sp. Root1204]